MSWMQYGSHPYEIGSDTMPKAVTPKDVAHSLARINRYTGHTMATLSVARHSVYVSKLLEINSWAALYGLVHDVHETVINDLSQPLKAALSARTRAELYGLAEKADAAMYKVLGVPWPVPRAYRTLVKEADGVAAATEKIYLMPECDRAWDMLKQKPTHVACLATTDVDLDAALWLERYWELIDALGVSPGNA